MDILKDMFDLEIVTYDKIVNKGKLIYSFISEKKEVLINYYKYKDEIYVLAYKGVEAKFENNTLFNKIDNISNLAVKETYKKLKLNNAIEKSKNILNSLCIPYKNVPIFTKKMKYNERGFTYREEGEVTKIEINKTLLHHKIEEKTLINTLLHEFVHTCYGCFNHGEQWQKYVVKINGIGFNITQDSTEQLELFARLSGVTPIYKAICSNNAEHIFLFFSEKEIVNIENCVCGYHKNNGEKCRGKLKLIKC